MVQDRWERDRLLSALADHYDLGELLVPGLVPTESVERVTALVKADTIRKLSATWGSG
ncbi:hypothetical protein ACFUJY_10525 [Streptomyces sp. NPDC057249]|uniref:hypothetical protein n=1 Tax=Streptomyces sp. NPDC057249 TaxID=3346067 RepID=UPI00362BA8DF